MLLCNKYIEVILYVFTEILQLPYNPHGTYMSIFEFFFFFFFFLIETDYKAKEINEGRAGALKNPFLF